ncbi:unnamed protein product, partial [Ixodes hexagonus]
QLCLCAFSNAAWNHKCPSAEWSLLPWHCLSACGIHSTSLPEPVPGGELVPLSMTFASFSRPLPPWSRGDGPILVRGGSAVTPEVRLRCLEHVFDWSVAKVSRYSLSATRAALSCRTSVATRGASSLFPAERLTTEETETLSDLKVLVAKLYESLSVSEFQLEQERKLLDRLHLVKEQLEPLEQKKQELMSLSGRRTTLLSWLGLGLMGMQFGILARLTWWEYSWDIMEPVTYFITYGTTMAMYAYFVVTRQDYQLPDVRDRQFLISFYKFARRQGMDVGLYNQLRDEMTQIEEDLQRLRDPLQKHLPLREIISPHRETATTEEGS